MARHNDVQVALAQAVDALRTAADKLEDVAASGEIDADTWLDVSAGIGLLLVMNREQMAKVGEGLGLGGARQRILRYLRGHIGETVSGAELFGVAGIGEWARRVRELRVELGWPIESGVQRPELRTDEYVLTADEPDEALAARWRTASHVRKLKTAPRERILTFLAEVSPSAADEEELTYVSKIRTWPAEIEILRDLGHPILSHVEDRRLAHGSYRLATDDVPHP